MASGGSCLAAPNGEWLIEPLGPEETLVTARIRHDDVLGERQNLDVSGHYSRPDITQLVLNRNGSPRFAAIPSGSRFLFGRK